MHVLVRAGLLRTVLRRAFLGSLLPKYCLACHRRRPILAEHSHAIVSRPDQFPAHRPTATSICRRMQDGSDSILMDTLRLPSPSLGFIVSLAHMKRLAIEISEPRQKQHKSWALERVVGVFGELQGTLPFNDEKACQEKRAANLGERYWRRSAVILLGKEHELDFYMQQFRKAGSSPN
ncbi:hypothetical protein EJ03DRAFT_155130 [Teratosphaeria nubilosa]|uniref:Uncharacterized protein n=1 Tax=Teratosphaeria nubilosa TaxID=161662 RepID=A0A6G1LKP1_9PEZI|nr:hypothetical protein EJ03DRAFT_155130 [Teratosphaeria nubilosa]